MTIGSSRPVSIRDVARRAGVSHQTVSRVINQSNQVKPATKARVEAAIQDLDYRPNSLAQAFARGRSGRIGVLIEGSSLYGPLSMMRGVELAAREAGYTSTAFTVTGESASELSDGVRFLNDQRVDAVAVILPREQSLHALPELPEASVLIGTRPSRVDPGGEDGTAGLPWVGVNQRLGTELVVRHLLDRGHRVIAHITGPAESLDSQARTVRWQELMREAGLGDEFVIPGDWSADAGYAAAPACAQIPGLTAVFAGNDQMALGLTHGLAELGLRVPDDISVVGFDDLPESGHFLPPLTTVRQNFEELGRVGMAVILRGLNDELSRESLEIDPTLVIRESTSIR
ncbi:MAG TPA: LacI family DNA-binding transcriptional regulator [Propionicimonas sp.]|jgi:DNA-binding LacI/PurR family transcriptional regulator|nr:LacI family DNA-binding transcriptional regulator [Propionicimonas sp.]